MLLKDDYCQSIPEVRVCKDPLDKHIEIWWFAKNENGDTYPVELQMSKEGTLGLIHTLINAYESI